MQAKDASALGLLLQKCRQKAGLTQDQLAMKLNRTQSCISKFEKGHKLPDIFTIMDWARITSAQEAIAMFVMGTDVTTIIQTVLQMTGAAVVFPLAA